MIRHGDAREHRIRLTVARMVAVMLTLSCLAVWMNLSLMGKMFIPNVSRDAPINRAYIAGIKVPTTTAAAKAAEFRAVDASASSSAGMSACLLVMDDNHFLIEWLAYHYHTMPLRYLVIAVDPRSKTRPESILKRWTSSNGTAWSDNKNKTKNNMNNQLTIITWNHDSDYVTTDEMKQAEDQVRRYFGLTATPDLVRHRARQRMFYFKCMQHMKQQHRHWTALIDTDEYLSLSYNTIRRYGRSDVPPVEEPGSILKFLNHELQQPDAFPNITTPCIQIPRIRFGAKESDTALVEKGVPSGFVGSAFQTLRWRMHATESTYFYNRISKALIDVSRVVWDDLQPVDSIHRPIRSLCSQRKLHITKSEQVLVLHHYLGTREQYFFRDDARQGRERSEKQYRSTKNVGTETDDVVRPWLDGFVRSVGHEAARELTKGAGDTSTV